MPFLVDEVANWAIANRENQSPLPPGPDGNRSERHNLAMQQILGAIARWRDEFSAGNGTFSGNLTAEGELHTFGTTAATHNQTSTESLIHVGVVGSIMGSTTTGGAMFGRNYYHDNSIGSWYRTIADEAAQIAFLGSGDIKLRTAVSDVADSAITWIDCLLYTSPSPRDGLLSRMPSSA